MNCLASKITTCSGKQEYKYCSKHYQQMRRHGSIQKTNRDDRAPITDGDVTRIPLGTDAKDGYALVDSQFAHLAKDKWRKTHWGYAIRSKDKKFLHRVLLNAGAGVVTDHINGNPLDNRLENLRICTQGENAKNQTSKRNTKTGVKGITPYKNTGRFVVRIVSNYKRYSLGIYGTMEEATEVYNKAAIELHGEYARLNNV